MGNFCACIITTSPQIMPPKCVLPIHTNSITQPLHKVHTGHVSATFSVGMYCVCAGLTLHRAPHRAHHAVSTLHGVLALPMHGAWEGSRSWGGGGVSHPFPSAEPCAAVQQGSLGTAPRAPPLHRDGHLRSQIGWVSDPTAAPRHSLCQASVQCCAGRCTHRTEKRLPACPPKKIEGLEQGGRGGGGGV